MAEEVVDVALLQERLNIIESNVNIGYTLISGFLVFFMQCGFAMLCAGSVRAKNAKNIILLNLMDACFGAMAWYFLGYAFAFGVPQSVIDGGDIPGSLKFIGSANFAMNNMPNNSNYFFWYFQFTFAATAATIVSGAVAERTKFACYIAYEVILVSFVYPCVAHWQWSAFGYASNVQKEGDYFLGAGFWDFAGDGPVHMVGGVASLAGALVIGPRLGRFDSNGQPVDMPGHNASLTLLGVFLLWFGWCGFNPGSLNLLVLGTTAYGNTVARVAITTTLSAAAGTISVLFITLAHSYITTGGVLWDLLMAGNGALAGLVAITGPCAFVRTWSAILIGLISGPVYYAASKFILHTLKVDDPVDAIAVHMFCAMWGNIATGLFADCNYTLEISTSLGAPSAPGICGVFMGGNGKMLAAQIVQVLIITGWTFGIMYPYFLMLKAFNMARVSPEVEAAGLDVSHHGGSAYPGQKEGGEGGALQTYEVNALVAAEVDKKIAALKAELTAAPAKV